MYITIEFVDGFQNEVFEDLSYCIPGKFSCFYSNWKGKIYSGAQNYLIIWHKRIRQKISDVSN